MREREREREIESKRVCVSTSNVYRSRRVSEGVGKAGEWRRSFGRMAAHLVMDSEDRRVG